MGPALVPILLGLVGTILLTQALLLHLRMKQLRMKSGVALVSW
jgi:hypothetical protein